MTRRIRDGSGGYSPIQSFDVSIGTYLSSSPEIILENHKVPTKIADWRVTARILRVWLQWLQFDVLAAISRSPCFRL